MVCRNNRLATFLLIWEGLISLKGFVCSGVQTFVRNDIIQLVGNSEQFSSSSIRGSPDPLKTALSKFDEALYKATDRPNPTHGVFTDSTDRSFLFSNYKVSYTNFKII